MKNITERDIVSIIEDRILKHYRKIIIITFVVFIIVVIAAAFLTNNIITASYEHYRTKDGDTIYVIQNDESDDNVKEGELYIDGEKVENYRYAILSVSNKINYASTIVICMIGLVMFYLFWLYFKRLERERIKFVNHYRETGDILPDYKDDKPLTGKGYKDAG